MGLPGTSYVITGCGMVTVPNNCEADNDVPWHDMEPGCFTAKYLWLRLIARG